jgi:A/G-specific adenine glycosylase
MLNEQKIRKLKTFFRAFYRERGREFTWRARDTPTFQLLLAEMLLRQTKAVQVEAVWPEIIKRYPTPELLSAADHNELLLLLRPLGFGFQRLDALTSVCRVLVSDYHSSVPSSPEELLALPHVGPYAAAAIACFSFGHRTPIVDANVLRVLGRIAGKDLGKDNRRSPEAWEIAWEILPMRSFADHNYGLLDFAALICVPRRPKCEACPLRTICVWGLTHS